MTNLPAQPVLMSIHSSRVQAFRCATLLVVGTVLFVQAHAAQVTIHTLSNAAPIGFATSEIESALKTHGHSAIRTEAQWPANTSEARIVITTTNDRSTLNALEKTSGETHPVLRAEGFSLRTTGASAALTIWVIGEDAGGALYGGLELAEQIRLK